MPLSYGFVETLGFIGALEAADAMLKAAKVKLIDKREIGFGLVTVIIEGELGAVQSSVDAGCIAAERVGQLVASNVIPRPYTDADFFMAYPKKKEKKDVKIIEMAESNIAPKTKKAVQQKPKLNYKTSKTASGNTQLIINILKKVPKNGATLREISKRVGIDQVKTRVILKELLDENIVEKVQQKYYLI